MVQHSLAADDPNPILAALSAVPVRTSGLKRPHPDRLADSQSKIAPCAESDTLDFLAGTVLAPSLLSTCSDGS